MQHDQSNSKPCGLEQDNGYIKILEDELESTRAALKELRSCNHVGNTLNDFEAKKYALEIASRNPVFETLPTAKEIYKWLIL